MWLKIHRIEILIAITEEDQIEIKIKETNSQKCCGPNM